MKKSSGMGCGWTATIKVDAHRATATALATRKVARAIVRRINRLATTTAIKPIVRPEKFGCKRYVGKA